MEYLVQCKVVESDETFNFIFEEKKLKQFLKMAKTVISEIKLTKLYSNLSQQEYCVRFSTNSEGGYVENRYGGFEFNF